MADHGSFLWCDVSSFRPDVTKPFYERLMGWQFDGGNYAIASQRGQAVAAVFEMPALYQKIGLPSFWMSYIGVSDVDVAVKVAREHGGKVELGPEPFPTGGRFALIRDPLGAGFTVFEGGTFQANPNRHHGLFVSDAAAVMRFYSALFNWTFGTETNGVRPILRNGRRIAHLHQIPDPALRGKEEFWAVILPTSPGTAARVQQLGGQIEAHVTLPEGAATLIRDPDNAALFLIESDTPNRDTPMPWRGWAGLALIALAIGTGWGWINALFLAIWIALGLRDRATYLFEPIERDRHPTLYWLVLASFAALAVLSAVYPALQ